KINFLLGALAHAAQNREVEYYIEMFSSPLDFWFVGRHQKFFGDQRIDAKLMHEIAHLAGGRVNEVDPSQRVLHIAREHTSSISSQFLLRSPQLSGQAQKSRREQ